MNKRFTVKVRNRAGETETIHREAESAELLFQQLAREQLVALDVSEDMVRRFLSLPVKQGAGKKEIRDFFFQMSTYLDAGIPLEKMFDIVSRQPAHASLQPVIKEVLRGIRSGKRLSELLAGYPDIFPGYITAALMAGEESGRLTESLASISAIIDKEISLKESLISALTYPLILLSTACLSVLLIIYFAVPRFVVMFADMGRDLPIFLKLMSLVSGNFLLTMAGLGITGTAIIAAILYIRQDPELRQRVETRLFHMPRLGELIISFQLTLYFRILGMALQSSLPVDRAIELANSTLFSHPIQEVFTELHREIRKGSRMAEVLGRVSWMPDTVISLVSAAEESGQLEEMSFKIADIIGRELDTLLKKIIALAEPLLILFVSVIIGGVIISMLYSLFSINF